MRSAIIVVDLQEDFLPPHGSLAVSDGRAIIPSINTLLDKNWAIRIASRDWHPVDHCSFANNNEGMQPFDAVDVSHPQGGPPQSMTLWPVHCVQNTKGAEYAPEFANVKFDLEVKKGVNKESEFYSAFKNVWGLDDTELLSVLKEKNVTHVFVCGLAYDFCVFHTAIDSAKSGFETFVIKDACKSINVDQDTETAAKLTAAGVQVIDLAADILQQV